MQQSNNPYPQFEQQIDESVAAQAQYTADPTLNNTTDDNALLLRTIHRSQVVLLILIQCFSLLFHMCYPFGILYNFFLFLTFILSLHVMIFSFKSRGIKKNSDVNKLHRIVFTLSMSLFIAMFSNRVIYHLGWAYIRPFATCLILCQAQNIVLLRLRKKNITQKQYLQFYLIGMFFIDLIISLINKGNLNFGYLIGELISFGYGSYFIQLRNQLYYPIVEIQEGNPQEIQIGRFQQSVQVFVSFFEIGNIPQTDPIDMDSYLQEKKSFQVIAKLVFLFTLISAIFWILPFLYYVAFLILLYFVHVNDTYFVQTGKVQEVKMHEYMVAPILVNLDLIGGYKYGL